MVNYREILRLRSLGYSITQIAAAVHSSRSTIRDVYQRADQHDISWQLSDETNAKSSFVPPCTKQVFMKYYSATMNDANYWTKVDAEGYMKDIEHCVKKLEE